MNIASREVPSTASSSFRESRSVTLLPAPRSSFFLPEWACFPSPKPARSSCFDVFQASAGHYTLPNFVCAVTPWLIAVIGLPFGVGGQTKPVPSLPSRGDSFSVRRCSLFDRTNVAPSLLLLRSRCRTSVGHVHMRNTTKTHLTQCGRTGWLPWVISVSTGRVPCGETWSLHSPALLRVGIREPYILIEPGHFKTIRGMGAGRQRQRIPVHSRMEHPKHPSDPGVTWVAEPVIEHRLGALAAGRSASRSAIRVAGF